MVLPPPTYSIPVNTYFFATVQSVGFSQSPCKRYISSSFRSASFDTLSSRRLTVCALPRGVFFFIIISLTKRLPSPLTDIIPRECAITSLMNFAPLSCRIS